MKLSFSSMLCFNSLLHFLFLISHNLLRKAVVESTAAHSEQFSLKYTRLAISQPNNPSHIYFTFPSLNNLNWTRWKGCKFGRETPTQSPLCLQVTDYWGISAVLIPEPACIKRKAVFPFSFCQNVSPHPPSEMLTSVLLLTFPAAAAAALSSRSRLFLEAACWVQQTLAASPPNGHCGILIVG